MEQSAPTPRRRRLRTVVVRTLLILTLLPQMGILWVLHRPSPTAIPSGLVELALEGALDLTTASVERATIDRRGVVRLSGLRLRHPEERRWDGAAVSGPGERAQADLEVTLVPAWGDWLLLRPSVPALRAQGRVGGETASTASPLLDRVDLRMDAGGGVAVARAGAFYLRADATGAPAIATPGEAGADLIGRARALQPMIATLAALRSFEGGAELVARPGGLSIEASGRMREGASLRNLELGGWEIPAGAADFTLRGRVSPGGAEARLRARELRLGPARISTAELSAGAAGDFRLVAEGLELAGVRGGGCLLEGRRGRWEGAGDWKVDARLAAELGESRLGGKLALSEGRLQLTEVNLAAPASDMLRLPGLGAFLREAGVDFAGRVELADAAALAESGRLVGASGRFALTKAGWGDIRPSSIRPERPASALSGRWSVAIDQGVFLLDDLDLAGLRGSIGGGLGKDEPYEVRLHSTAGNPVHPGCLNSLLGGWWVDLWRRFDLTTTGVAPHADVRVRGRWGRPEAQVEVAAELENFGFMGARFAATRVRVQADPARTVARLEHLEGAQDGKSAGTARGLIRWDWQKPEWQGRPEILAEGDLEPAIALRLHDPEQAQRLRGWSFGLPWTKVKVVPGKPTEVEMVTGESSLIGGVTVGPMSLRLSHPDLPEARTELRIGAAFAGGRLEVDLRGNLADQNEVRRLALVDVWVADLQKSLPGLLGPATPAGAVDPASLSAEFQGSIDLLNPGKAEGGGKFRLKDPRLKTVHLLGGLSEGLGALGVDFSSYPLTEAIGTFTLKDGQANLRPLRLEGEDAWMELEGWVALKDGQVNLTGEFHIKRSPWGILGYINPNRLISKILKINIRGTLKNPKARVEPRPF